MKIDFILSEYSLPCGKLFSPLDLVNEPSGISGTEVNLFGNAFELARRGHFVRIVSKWKQEHNIDNLYFVDIDIAHKNCDVAIAYHDGRPLNDWNAKFKIALHQTFEIQDGVQAASADLFLSATYVNMKHHLNRDGARWAILPNACDFGNFHPWKPEKGRMIFHTDPSRGLHVLLRALPKIKEKVPEAHLHIYSPIVLESCRYFYKNIYNEVMEKLEECKDYVTVHARSHSKNEMLEEISKSAVFAYPSEPPRPCEVFPISVMECCTAGVPVVLSPADGIEEIYREAVDLIASPPSDNLDNFINATVKVLTDYKYNKELSEKGLKWAKQFSFEKTADILEDLINKYSNINLNNNLICLSDCNFLYKILEIYPYIKKEINVKLNIYSDFQKCYNENKDNYKLKYTDNALNKLYNLGVTNFGNVPYKTICNELGKSKLMLCFPDEKHIQIAVLLGCLPVIFGESKEFPSANTNEDYIKLIINLLNNENYYS